VSHRKTLAGYNTLTNESEVSKYTIPGMVYFCGRRVSLFVSCTMKNEKLIHRLSRIQGQIEAIKRSLIAETDDCARTIEQVKASSQGLKKFAQAYVENHLEACVLRGTSVQAVHNDLGKVIQASFII